LDRERLQEQVQAADVRHIAEYNSEVKKLLRALGLDEQESSKTRHSGE
jgi:hypothetical protein